jgi:putative heme-binding domain-containing protein
MRRPDNPASTPVRHGVCLARIANLEPLSMNRPLSGRSAPAVILVFLIGLAPTAGFAAEPAAAGSDESAARVAALIAEARSSGDPERGAEVFLDARLACVSCHKVGTRGGEVGPDLTNIGLCLKPEQIVEAVLWPRRQVKEGFAAVTVACHDGTLIQGYRLSETATELVLREAATGKKIPIARETIDEIRETGTLMPEGLAEAMTAPQRADLVRFLMSLGRPEEHAGELLNRQAHAHTPAAFAFDRAPLRPELWPSWKHEVNRDRLYDFYAKEAEFFSRQPTVPPLLPQYPGLDGGQLGHWGNQDETTWSDGRWNETDIGSVQCGVFRGRRLVIPKGVCIRLGDQGELAACFNPETLCYEALWRGGFLKFSPQRHGFLGGLIMDGTLLPRPATAGAGKKPDQPFVYHGYYRHGKRVVFAYRIGDVELLDAPWVDEAGEFTRSVAPADEHPLALAGLTRGGPPQWPEPIATRGTLGQGRPYAVDTIEPPFENPWKALMFFGDHDFLPDGSALLCTMQGDVWRVEGLDQTLTNLRWRRIASGLHHALGLVVADGKAYVLGRDQITRLNDLNGDGETDFYECFSNAYTTSPAGHDFITGLQRDAQGRFYTVSGKAGLLRISPDGTSVEVVATGFRNADGVGMSPEGIVTVPNSEGEWVPASMVCEVRPGGHYGYRGPKNGQPPDLPLVYLPRGLDNSSASQVFITNDDERWGPGSLRGQLIHLTFGAGTAYLLLREQVDGQPQGAIVPFLGEFASGVHRGRFNPRDGQLYVSGMAGWGTYTTADGCFQRVRYTGDPVQLPVAFHARENGVLVTFSGPLDRALAEQPRSHFAQAWNYRYSAGYGSPEFSTRHPDTLGHDALEVRSAHVLDDGRTLFLELPELQPVNQLQLHLRVDSGPPHDLFATVHKLGAPFTGFAGYRAVAKTIAAHPILADLARAGDAQPNPWRWRIPGLTGRPITIEAGTNLSFTTTSFTARAGEPIALTFVNPDVVPHNWALARPGTLARVGDLINKIIAEPDAAARQYVPRTDDVLVYTDIVYPNERATIHFRAPDEPGRYPFLCTFPGHWMVMNGVLVVQ